MDGCQYYVFDESMSVLIADGSQTARIIHPYKQGRIHTHTNADRAARTALNTTKPTTFHSSSVRSVILKDFNLPLYLILNVEMVSISLHECVL